MCAFTIQAMHYDLLTGILPEFSRHFDVVSISLPAIAVLSQFSGNAHGDHISRGDPQTICDLPTATNACVAWICR